MSLVITRQRPSVRESDTPLDRFVRLVPIEVVSLYAAAVVMGRGAWPHLDLGLLVAGVIATPLVMAHHARRLRLTVSLAQHLVRILSFIAWSFALTNPLTPAAPVAGWIPAVAIVMVPTLGTMMFPPAELP